MESKTWRVRDGHPIHDGDCTVFSYGVCTCGLLHHLMPYQERREQYPKFGEELGRQSETLQFILEHDVELRRRIEMMKPMSEEEFEAVVKDLKGT